MRLGTVDGAAKLLSINTQRMYELARRDNFFPPGVIVRLGRQIRVNEEALKRWIEKGGSAKLIKAN